MSARGLVFGFVTGIVIVLTVVTGNFYRLYQDNTEVNRKRLELEQMQERRDDCRMALDIYYQENSYLFRNQGDLYKEKFKLPAPCVGL